MTAQREYWHRATAAAQVQAQDALDMAKDWRLACEAKTCVHDFGAPYYRVQRAYITDLIPGEQPPEREMLCLATCAKCGVLKLDSVLSYTNHFSPVLWFKDNSLIP